MGLGALPRVPVLPRAVKSELDMACERLADAFADDAISALELDATAEAVVRSPVAARLVAAGLVMPFPAEPVFVYWNATTLGCDGCGVERGVSRVHLRNVHRMVPGVGVERGRHRSAALCRWCVSELEDLGMRTR